MRNVAFEPRTAWLQSLCSFHHTEKTGTRSGSPTGSHRTQAIFSLLFFPLMIGPLYSYLLSEWRVRAQGKLCEPSLYKCYLFRTKWSGPVSRQINVDGVSSGRAWEPLVLCWKVGVAVRRRHRGSWPHKIWVEKCRKVTGRQDWEYSVLKHSGWWPTGSQHESRNKIQGERG